MKASELLSISSFNPRELDRVTGVQRQFKRARSQEIADYIDEYEGSVIANNIIINIDESNIHVQHKDGCVTLEINKLPNSSFIIDGQHRLRAFEKTDKDFELPVSCFVNLTLADRGKYVNEWIKSGEMLKFFNYVKK